MDNGVHPLGIGRWTALALVLASVLSGQALATTVSQTVAICLEKCQIESGTLESKWEIKQVDFELPRVLGPNDTLDLTINFNKQLVITDHGDLYMENEPIRFYLNGSGHSGVLCETVSYSWEFINRSGSYQNTSVSGDASINAEGSVFTGTRCNLNDYQSFDITDSPDLFTDGTANACGVRLRVTPRENSLIGNWEPTKLTLEVNADEFQIGDACSQGGGAAATAEPCNTGCPIPAMSTWGLVVMTLLLSTAGELVLRSRAAQRPRSKFI